MHNAVADELRLPQRGNHGKDPLLLRKFQVRLEAHDVIDIARRIVLPKLDDGIRLLSRARVGQTDGLERTVAERIDPAPRHDLDRHAALEHILILKAVHLRLLRRGKLPHKVEVLLLRHTAVDVVRATAVVARGEPRLLHIDGILGHKRRGGIEKVQILRVAEVSGNGVAHRLRGQRTRRHDHGPLGHARDLLGDHGDVRVRAELLRHHGRKAVAIDRKTAARLDPRRIGAGKDQASQPPQLLLEQTDGVFQSIAAQGVGADQLRKILAPMRGTHLFRLHLVQPHGKAALCQLPRRLAAGKTGADHLYFRHFFVPFDVFVVFVVFFVVLVDFFAVGSSFSSSAVSTVSAVALGILR